MGMGASQFMHAHGRAAWARHAHGPANSSVGAHLMFVSAPCVLCLHHATCPQVCMRAWSTSGQRTGPDAIKGLRGTIKKLQAEVAAAKGDAQLARYKALQQDLRERDAVNTALRQLLVAHFRVVGSEQELDGLLDGRVLKEGRLYGASR